MENLVDAEDLASCTVVTATCAMVIVAPLDGSPAEEAGLRSGDRVLEPSTASRRLASRSAASSSTSAARPAPT